MQTVQPDTSFSFKRQELFFFYFYRMKIHGEYLLYFVLSSFFVSASAQNPVIDSLLSLVKKDIKDTNKVIHLNELTRQFTDLGSYDTAFHYSGLALELSKNINFKKGEGEAYGNTGTIFYYQADYPNTLANWLKALQTEEARNNKYGIAKWMGNIGSVYKEQRKFPEALDYYFESLRLFEGMGDKNKTAAFYGNIGIVYFLKNDTLKALDYYEKALKIKEEIGDKAGIAIWKGNIGQVYKEMQEFDKALDYYLEAQRLDEEMGDKNGIASDLGNIGTLYLSLKKYDNAEKYLLRALEIDKEIGALQYQMQFEKDLSDLYTRTGKFQQALEHYRKSAAAKDSMFSQDKTEEITRNALNYQFEKREAAAKAKQEIKDAVASEEKRTQAIIRNSIAGGLGAVLLFSFIVYRQRNRISKEKKRSDELLLNILPSETAEELKLNGYAEPKQFDKITVLFTDFKGFTRISETMTAKELVSELDFLFKNFDKIISKYPIEKIKTIGDAYMCAGGLPAVNTTHTADITFAALEIQKFMKEHNEKKIAEGKPAFEIRIGIHTGPVIAGIVGIKKFAYDIWGDTVNIASRMESSGEAGKINISGAAYQVLHNLQGAEKLNFEFRGKIPAKNKGEIEMYFVS